MWATLETRKSNPLLCGASGHGIDCCQVTGTREDQSGDRDLSRGQRTRIIEP
jgi:hypothetical protein